MGSKGVGDLMEIGDDCCICMEGDRCARITGFLKEGDMIRPMVRKYLSPDEPFPSGEYRVCLIGPWPVRERAQ